MTTLTSHPGTLHDSLIAALNGSDPERALEQSFVQISRGGSLPLALAMVKALTRAGLGGLAARLLQSAGGLLAAEPQLAALAETLMRVPSGEVPAAVIHARFAANRQALLDVQPRLGPRLMQLALPAIHVFKSVKGNQHAIWSSEGNRIEFIFAFADHAAAALSLQIEPLTVGSGFVNSGVPSPAVFKRLISARCDNGYEPPIDIIEPDERVFAAWLCLIDDPQMLRKERLSVFLGDDALEQYRQHLLDHPARRPATQCLTHIRPGLRPPVIDRKFNESIVERLMARKREVKVSLDGLYRTRRAAFWRDRYATAGCSALPLRIVGSTTRFSTVLQHSMRDLAAAFRRRGCEFHIATQPTAHEPVVDLAHAIAQHEPDLVIVFNHLRAELRDDVPANVPFVCWIQDYMPQLWNRQAGATVGEYDLVLCHAPDIMAANFGYPADCLLATANLTSIDQFSPAPIAAHERSQHECDLAYAGHGSETPEQLIDQAAGQNREFAAMLHACLRLARQTLEQTHCFTTQDLVRITLQAECESDQRFTLDARRSLIVPAVQRILDRVLRHQTLEWAANWAESRHREFRIYGRGWEKHPRLARHARGEVAHGHALRCMYQGAKINLQVNAYGSLHQRLLDGLASGGFMLARYNPADFVPLPFRVIQQFILNHNVQTLPQLLAQARVDASLQHALRQAEELTGTRLGSIADPVRAAHVAAHVQCGTLPEQDFSDEGLFNLLRTMKGLPQRAACDLPNFASITFQSQAQMHEMLDRLVDDASARRSICEPMRRCVIEHDTYDALAGRIVRAFEQRWSEVERLPCA